MKLKNTAITNGVAVKSQTTNDYRSNPDWGMDIGQGAKHTFVEPGVAEIMNAMVYYMVDDTEHLLVALGKGSSLHPISHYAGNKNLVIASLFPKVYIDDNLLEDQALLMFVTKNMVARDKNGNPSVHYLRRELKFSRNLKYHNDKINEKCFDAISEYYGEGASWAVLKMLIRNEDELHLYGIRIADTDKRYGNKKARNEDFDRLWKIQHPDLDLYEDDEEEVEDVEDVESVEGAADEYNLLNDFECNFEGKTDQIIYYGVPGCGKSRTLKEELEDREIDKDNVKRVVFHPDYTSSDFIGQILPETNEKNDIEYLFNPGPFTEILDRAYHDLDTPYALVIEEINRGNAPAIFGEVFQLLDRKKDDEDKEGPYGKGWSEYSVYNKAVIDYIGLPDDEGFRLPPNLSLFATMNTSDQNVFTLDNAFQRRWDMVLVSNHLAPHKDQYKMKIEGTDVSWGKFRDVVNKKIVSAAAEAGLSSLEDKRLGAWFVLPNENGVVSTEVFSNKVLKYLWDDAFKTDRAALFNDCAEKTLEDIIDDFEENGFEIFTSEFASNFQ